MPISDQFLTTLLTQYVPSAAILTAFVTAIAYLRAPRLKVLVFSMPIPFTCAYLATDLPIDATHMLGMILVVAYHWIVYALHVRLRLSLGLAIAAGVACYMLTAVVLRPLSAAPFHLAAGVVLTLWTIALVHYRPARETGYRSTAPWWLKLPLIFLIAIVLFSLKALLAGAVTTFPYAGVFTSYEMRHNLRALAGQFTVTVIAVIAMIITIHITRDQLGWSRYAAVAAGWAAVALSLALVYPLRIQRGKLPPAPTTEIA